MIQFAINKFNKIDVLINNAGISQEGLFTDVTEEEWQKNNKYKFKFSILL